MKTWRKTNEMLEVFFASLGVLGESLWSLERPRGVFGAPLERPRTRNAYRTIGISMISKPVLFTFVPSLGGAGRSLERLWGVFGSPLVPIGKFWVEKDGSEELRRAPPSSDEAFRREVRRLRGSMRETLSFMQFRKLLWNALSTAWGADCKRFATPADPIQGPQTQTLNKQSIRQKM